MSYGNILGQLLQNGMGGRNPTRSRIDRSAQSLGRTGGTDNIVAMLQNALSGTGRAGAGGGGGFAERSRDFLGKQQAGGLTGAQIGGIGAAAGAVLGRGGLGGAARGGALAVLGTLALSALRESRGGAGEPTPDEIRDLTAPDTERLLVRAMISAAKADGQIDQVEMTRILGKLQGDEASADERQYVLDAMGTPADARAVAAEVTSQVQAAEVYAASLMAIELDSEAEREYLRDLAAAMNLDAGTVERLHATTGAPVA